MFSCGDCVGAVMTSVSLKSHHGRTDSQAPIKQPFFQLQDYAHRSGILLLISLLEAVQRLGITAKAPLC